MKRIFRLTPIMMLAFVLVLSSLPPTAYMLPAVHFDYLGDMNNDTFIVITALDGSSASYKVGSDPLPVGLSWNKLLKRLEMKDFHATTLRVLLQAGGDHGQGHENPAVYHPKLNLYVEGNNSLVNPKPGPCLLASGGVAFDGPSGARLTLQAVEGAPIDIASANTQSRLDINNITLIVETDTASKMAINAPFNPGGTHWRAMKLRGDAYLRMKASQTYEMGSSFIALPFDVQMFDNARIDIEVLAHHHAERVIGVERLRLNGVGHVSMSLLGGNNTTIKKSIDMTFYNLRGDNYHNYSIVGAWGELDRSPSNYYATEFLAGTKLVKKDGPAPGIPKGNDGTAIQPIDLTQYLQGGVGPYSFGKLSGPQWVKISREGIVSGVRPQYENLNATVVGYVVRDKLGREHWGQFDVSEVVNPRGVTASLLISRITPEETTVTAGDSIEFKATVKGDIHLSKDILWSVTGNEKAGTKISNKGLLTVSPEETATTLTVKATAEADSGLVSEATVHLLSKPKEKYSISITRGRAIFAEAEAGAAVSIAADIVENMEFDKWVGTGGVKFADAGKMETTFTMPKNPVTITATYKARVEKYYSATLVGAGTIEPAKAQEGEAVTLVADSQESMVFLGWASENGIEIYEVAEGIGVFIMPAKDVKIFANYEKSGEPDKSEEPDKPDETEGPEKPKEHEEPEQPASPEPVVLQDEKVERKGEFIYVQARQFEALGAQFAWDGTARVATFKVGQTTVAVKIDSTEATVNGDKKAMTAPAFIRDGRTFIPIRFVSEQLGWNVHWQPGDIVTIGLR